MPTPIYHITHGRNLSRIIQTGGLWCDAERIRQGFECVGTAHERLNVGGLASPRHGARSWPERPRSAPPVDRYNPHNRSR
jgi:hypothetical protein